VFTLSEKDKAMKPALIYLATFSFLIPENVLAQNYLEWSETKLSWNNFAIKHLPHSRTGAITASGIYFSYTKSNQLLDVEIKAQMDTEASWVNSHSMNDDVLAHEQLHFDISELHARMLRKYFSDHPRIDKFQKPETIYKNYMNLMRKMQNDYDQQTHHGNNKAMQLMWQNKIENMLLELSSFKENRIVMNTQN
jgi:hypothetical protein